MITVHGLLGGPSVELVGAAAAADWVVGGSRHLDRLAVPGERRITLGALSAAVTRIAGLPEADDIVVVASGDPLYYGVVRSLRAAGLRPRVVPSVGSIATAFARVGLPWDDAVVVSVHGRPLAPALALARSHPKVAVFTSAENGIRELAAGLAGRERTFVLAERLGEPDERVRVLDAPAAAAVEPVEPNVVLVLAAPPQTLDDASTLCADAPGVREPVIGQVTSGPASLVHAARIDEALGTPTRRYADGAVTGLPQAWAECDLVISHLALGATTRIIAPLLASKKTDPCVVVVDEAGRFAVPLVGGHGGGANDLARRIADALGGTAVLTTATDAVGLPGLDTLGWPWSGDVAGVTRAILDGEPVAVVRTQRWPLPPLPKNVTVVDAGEELPADAVALVLVTDEDAVRRPFVTLAALAPQGPLSITPFVTLAPLAPQGPLSTTTSTVPEEASRGTSDDVTKGRRHDAAVPTVVLNPPSLVAGMGCNRGTSVNALHALLTTTVADAGLDLRALAALTSVDAKADEAGLVALAARLGVPFVTYPAETLAAHDVPNPSAHAEQAVGTPSVAEASVLAHGAVLVVDKKKTPEATCAIGRLPARGRLTVIGLGPGSRDLTTPRAQQAIREATVVVGYRPYVAQVKDLLAPGVRIASTPMGKEEERTATAIQLAREGNNVALVCSGDPAIYAMASPTLEQGTDGIDVEIVPGVTASLAASAILGAPLGHDHATISLSDLHTDWDTILKRVAAAAEADLVTVLYNPRSRTRLHHLPDALALFATHRPPQTPVAVVEEADRPDQKVTLSTLADFDPAVVNMNSLVVVGSSTTRYLPAGAGRTVMVTPRDYHWMKP